MLYCDQCDTALAEKDTREAEKYIKIEAGKESNIWFGLVKSWGEGLVLETDLHFCGWTCFTNHLTEWFFNLNDQEKENE